VSGFLARRAVTTVAVLVMVSVMAFALVFCLPGDPALAILGDQQARDQRLYQTLRAELGLDRPLALQYAQWAARAARGDLGRSVRTGHPVLSLVVERLAPTLELSALALALAVAVALPLGVVSAARPRSWADGAGSVFAMGGVGIPHFLLGILLIYVFAVWLRWLPPSGYAPLTGGVGANVQMMLLPALTLGLGLAAVLMRQVRSALLDVLRQDYITTARSKGVGERRVVGLHALRNALVPVLTIIGLQMGRLFGGAVVVETIFGIPGVGRLAVDSIFFRDFPVVQGVVLVLAVGVLLSNLVTDLLYAVVDPRIRYAE
jgi:peptide/nickel transport system permease protein